MLELLHRCDEWNHDFRTDIYPAPFRSHGRLEDGAPLHLRDLGIRYAESATAMTQHRIRLSEPVDDSVELGTRESQGSRQQLALFSTMGEKLVQRRIEQTDGHGQAIHRLEDSLEVAALHWDEIIQRAAPTAFVSRHDHLTHRVDAIPLEE